jgi:hypothetical protein
MNSHPNHGYTLNVPVHADADAEFEAVYRNILRHAFNLPAPRISLVAKVKGSDRPCQEACSGQVSPRKPLPFD